MNNSAGIMNFGQSYEMVRSGIITYGMYPSDEVDPQLLPLQPVVQWVTRVAYVKTLPAGRAISYGGTFVTTRETKVATLPVGYADGYRRSLSGKGYVLIHGKKAPILGRVCMDQTMVDVTDIPDVKLDDKVILIGRSGQEEITIDEMAAETGTINYEIICGLSRRIPRAYYRDGKKVGEVHYLLDNRETENGI
jgi:alanine racemase